MSHALNELMSAYNVKAVEDEAKTAEVIAKHSVRIRDGLSRIEKSKEKWEPEYQLFDPGPKKGIVAKSRTTESRYI